MIDQMVEFGFKERVSLDILQKNETQPDMLVQGATSTQNSKLLISLSLFCNYEMYAIQLHECRCLHLTQFSDI